MAMALCGSMLVFACVSFEEQHQQKPLKVLQKPTLWNHYHYHDDDADDDDDDDGIP